MRVVDANVLLYAVNADTAHHQASHRWLNAALAGGDTVAFSWTVLTAFVRISTKVGLFPHPLSPDDAMAQVENWLRAPGATVVHPSSAHLGILTRLLLGVGTGGNLVNDAHLAALALEHGATVVSYDADFSRFAGLRWDHPDAL